MPVVIPRCHSFTFNLTTKITAGGEVISNGYATKKIEGDVVSRWFRIPRVKTGRRRMRALRFMLLSSRVFWVGDVEDHGDFIKDPAALSICPDF